jgi:hypothetical protein
VYTEFPVDTCIGLQHSLFFRHYGGSVVPTRRPQDMVVFDRKAALSRFRAIAVPPFGVVRYSAICVNNPEECSDKIVSWPRDSLLIFFEKTFADKHGLATLSNINEELQPPLEP